MLALMACIIITDTSVLQSKYWPIHCFVDVQRELLNAKCITESTTYKETTVHGEQVHVIVAL